MNRSPDQTPDLYALMENLPGDSPAWNLVDAFDAVTNGIENPEALAGMDRIGESALEPWKTLVRAIRALYAGDIAGCRRASEDLDETSAPGVLKPLFRVWLTRRGTKHRDIIFQELSGSRDSVINLYRRLIIEPHPLALMAEQAEEALRHGMDEQFGGLAPRVLRELQDQRRCDGPLLAIRYGLYCLRLLDQAGYGGDNFFSIILKTLGRADGFCVLAFALIGRDNEAAAAALRGALEAEGGFFLDGTMAPLIGEILVLLEAETPKRPPRAPVRKKRKPSPQLELFGDPDG
ncbi:MAG: hypothetical protein LBP32_09245 [Spirochaetaceae bacterium]|nr:hypothetical protein [Spirochaetaceae bacterium]